MEHGDIQEWASFLINVIYGGEASIGMRLRAMQCLCMLTDEETLEEVSGRTMSHIRFVDINLNKVNFSFNICLFVCLLKLLF